MDPLVKVNLRVPPENELIDRAIMSKIRARRQRLEHEYTINRVKWFLWCICLLAAFFLLCYNLAGCTPVEAPCRPEDATKLREKCIAIAFACEPEPADCPELIKCLAEANDRMIQCLR